MVSSLGTPKMAVIDWQNVVMGMSVVLYVDSEWEVGKFNTTDFCLGMFIQMLLFDMVTCQLSESHAPNPTLDFSENMVKTLHWQPFEMTTQKFKWGMFILSIQVLCLCPLLFSFLSHTAVCASLIS